MESYSVPDLRFMLDLGSDSSPRYFQNASWIKVGFVHLFPISFLDQADNPSRLVLIYGDSNISSFPYPYPTLLDGILQTLLDLADIVPLVRYVVFCISFYIIVVSNYSNNAICWVQSYRLSFPLYGLMVSLYHRECASFLHLEDGYFTHTQFKLLYNYVYP